MGLLDIFKSPKKQRRDATDAIFRKMENEIKEMQEERSNWDKSFEIICSRRSRANDFEKMMIFNLLLICIWRILIIVRKINM